MPKILVTALSPDSSFFHYPYTKEQLEQMVAQGEKAKKDAGFDTTVYWMAPDSPTGTLAGFIEMLKSGEWDGVLIGRGVRTDPKMTEWFEQLVNATREHSPKSKFIFNEDDQDSLGPMKRVFPTK
ncbi:hypothetical protein FRB97_006705 [Tulasnella sp. 331]|nr:hypothetical protein FRB97_006705 [Tulasnella sp. 331]